ncbi:hypothetical protein [Catenuloplanes japonicus]|uniref:hypothetical protein n=1 Tax=Catenuloplanes japonicus TaxID=33876 RepID=UPI000524739A|nr:hypothetical protein [Catenuloplanes japonicus]
MRHFTRAVTAAAASVLVSITAAVAATPAQAAAGRPTWECAVEVQLLGHDCAARVLGVRGELDTWEWGSTRDGTVSERGLREWVESHA